MQAESLTLSWAYGFNKDNAMSVHSLCGHNRNALFFTSSHSGIVYDFEQRTQTILQGHCNIITSCVIDKSKKWIVTADSGMDSIIIIWDAVSCLPIKTFVSPNEMGIEDIDISGDAVYIAAISSYDVNQFHKQDIAIWSWMTDSYEPILTHGLPDHDQHHSIKFNPNNYAELVVTGSRTITFWNWDEFRLEFYKGVVSKTDLGNYTGNFVSTIFLSSTNNCVSGTTDGYVVFWESLQDKGLINEKTLKDSTQQSKTVKIATKVLRLIESGINVMTTTFNDYLAIGCSDGAVRFYDFFLRLEAWFEDLNAGPIKSISFSVQQCPFPSNEAGSPGLKFWVPDFIIGTSDAFVVGVESSLFDEVRKDDRRGTLLLQGMSDEVTSVACSPSQSLVAMACSNGILQVWNYDLKLLMILREFNSSPAVNSKVTLGGTKTSTSHGKGKLPQLRASCLSFDTSGEVIAIGFSNGFIKLLKAETLEDISSYAPTTDSIIDLKFSVTGSYMACYDSSNHVLLFKKDESHAMVSDDKTKIKLDLPNYVYIGRSVSHTSRIVGISFGYKDIQESLVSVSEDKFCVEYDLKSCSVTNGLVCVKFTTSDGNQRSSSRLEVFSTPTAVLWYPRSDEDVEDRFVIANDEFKLKEFNLDSKQCRRTTLAPRFGNPINNILTIPKGKSNFNYYAFSTPSKVIGLGMFPLSGDPSKVMGVVAHPGQISSLSISFDGRFLFSAGGSDLSVNMWKVDPVFSQSAFDAITSENNYRMGILKEQDSNFYANLEPGMKLDLKDVQPYMSPFLSLLEGEDIYRDIVDYFYYSQLRHAGEESMEARKLSGKIPVEETPSLMRSIGFYPSEEEVVNMINEAKYKSFAQTGKVENYINLDDFIRLYINHRPVLPLENLQIVSAFNVINNTLAIEDQESINWGKLKSVLLKEGEKLLPSDLDSFLIALMGHCTISDDEPFNANQFAEQLLGFEDFKA